MKRLLILTIGILLSAGLGVALSRYTLAFTDNQTVTDKIFSQAGVTQPTDSTDPSVLEAAALTGDYPFQNLYLYMYNNVLNGAQKAAVKALSSRSIDGLQFTEDQLTGITQNGDTTAIQTLQTQRAQDAQSTSTVQSQTDAQSASDQEFEQYLADNKLSDSTKTLLQSMYEQQMRPSVASPTDISQVGTQAVVLAVYTDVMSAYQDELDLQQNNRKLAYQSLANEMFVNDDLSDSANIDLLYDLDLAHYVLFGSYITYPNRSSGQDVNLASLNEAEADLGSASPANPNVALASDTVSPYACLDDTALHAALDSFETDGSGATASAPQESSITYPDPAAVAESVTSDPASVETATQAAESTQSKLQDLSGFIGQLSGSKGDWTRALPCGDVFCITVKLIDGDQDPVASGDYAETDDCIACHVAYINKSLSDTTDHSLVAGKVSKNWFEDATCKDAGNQVNLDINVYAIKKSIDLDPGDDIVNAPANDIQNLKSTLLHVGAFPTLGAPETQIGKTPAEVECDSLLNLNTLAGSPQTLQDVQKQCQTASDQIQAQIASVYDQSQVEGMNTDMTTLYTQVSAELYKMAVTFRNLQEELQSTYKGDNAPLPALLAKKYCE